MPRRGPTIEIEAPKSTRPVVMASETPKYRQAARIENRQPQRAVIAQLIARNCGASAESGYAAREYSAVQGRRIARLRKLIAPRPASEAQSAFLSAHPGARNSPMAMSANSASPPASRTNTLCLLAFQMFPIAEIAMAPPIARIGRWTANRAQNVANGIRANLTVRKVL